MANATKYVDGAVGNDGNSGNSPGSGNAYATIATALGAITGGGNVIHVKASATYTITSALAVTIKGDSTNGRNRIEGYTTTPGARDGRPVITCATNGVAIFSLTDADYWTFAHFNLTHTASTRGLGFAGNVSGHDALLIDDCIIDGMSYGIDVGYGMTNLTVRGGEIKNCVNDGYLNANGDPSFFDGVTFASNGRDGIRISYAVGARLTCRRCVFRTNTGRGIYQAYTTAAPVAIVLQGNTFRGNGSSGYEDAATGANAVFVHDDNVYYGNGAYGVKHNITAAELALACTANANNAYGSNTSGARSVLAAGANEITLTADPFTSSTDSTPNATAGGGALLRYAGTNYGDVGAVQHQASGGGSVAFPVLGRLIG